MQSCLSRILKYLERKYNKPDSGTVSALNSIKQNPKFAKLVTFALNCLMGQTYLPNNKHRDNVRYILTEKGEIIIIEALDYHYLNDIIVQNAACVLNRLIGIGSYREEDISQRMISNNLHVSLQKVSEKNTNLSKESINNIIDLIENMMLSQSAELANLLYGILFMVRESNVQDIKKALELVYRMADLGGDKDKICEQVNQILKSNSDDIGIIQVSLRLLGIVAVKDKVDFYLIIDIMNKHKDIDIQQIGGRVLIAIVGSKDIEQALESLKQLKSDTDITLLSALIMDDKFIQEHPELALAFLELLRLNKKNKKILLNCLIGIGRVADQNEDLGQKLYDNGVINTCLEMADNDDIEIVRNSIQTMEKISVITHFDNEVVTKVDKIMNSKIKEELIVEAGLQLLISNGQGGFQQVIQKAIENHMNNREICELMSKLFFLHCNQVGEYKKIENIIKLLHDRYYWRTMCYYLLKGINVLRDFKELKKNSKKIIAYLVEILNQQQYVDDKEEDGFEEEQEENFKYQSELKDECVKLISKIMSKEELQLFTMQLNDSNSKENELKVYEISYCVLVQQLGEFYLRTELYKRLAQLKLSEAQLSFYSNFSLLFWNVMAKDQYKKKQITEVILNSLLQALEKGVYISQALDTLIYMSGSTQTQGTIDIIIDNNVFLDLINYDPNPLFIILTNTIKKYSQFQTQSLIAIYELLKFNPCATSCINSGTPRLIATLLDDQGTTPESAYQIIRILNYLKQNQYLMQVISFINQHPYNLPLRKLAQEYFSQYDPQQIDFTKDIKTAIKKQEYQQLSAYALLPDLMPDDIYDILENDYEKSPIFITAILGAIEQDERFIPLMTKSANKKITRNHLLHLCNTLNNYQITLKPDDINNFVNYLIKYDEDQQIIDLINQFLFNDDTNEYLVKTRYVKRLIKLTKLYILFEFQSKQFQIKNNLNWLYIMSNSAGDAIRTQGAVSLCMAVIRHEIAFHIKTSKQRKSFRSKLRQVPHHKETNTLVHVALKLLKNLVKPTDNLDIYKLLSLQNSTTILLALDVISTFDNINKQLIQPLLIFPDQDVQKVASKLLYSQETVAQLKQEYLLSSSKESYLSLVQALQHFEPDQSNLELSQSIIAHKQPNIQLLSLLIQESPENRSFILETEIPQKLIQNQQPSQELFQFLNLCIPAPSPKITNQEQEEIPQYTLPANYKVPRNALDEFNKFAAFQKDIPLQGEVDSEAVYELIKEEDDDEDEDEDEKIENIIEVVENCQYFLMKNKENPELVSDLTEYLINYQLEYQNNEELQNLLLRQLEIQSKYPPNKKVIESLKKLINNQQTPTNETIVPTSDFNEQVILHTANLAVQSKENKKELEDIIFEKGTPLAKLNLLNSYEKDEINQKILLKSDQFMIENLMIAQFQQINEKLKLSTLDNQQQEDKQQVSNEQISDKQESETSPFERIEKEKKEDQQEQQTQEEQQDQIVNEQPNMGNDQSSKKEEQPQPQPQGILKEENVSRQQALNKKSKTVLFKSNEQSNIKKSATMKETKPIDSIQEKLQVMLQNGELNNLLQLEQTAWKMVQSGVVDQLLQMDPLPWESLYILTQHPKIAKVILDPKTKLYQELLKALNNNPETAVIQTVSNLPPRGLAKFNQTGQIIQAINSNPEQRKAGLITLQKLNLNEKILLKNQEEQIKFIENNYNQVMDPETNILMNKLIEQIAHDQETQSKLKSVQPLLVNNMGDPEVGASNTNALANLVFNNKENAEEILDVIPKLQEGSISNPEKASAICLLYNSMAYKNDKIKEQLGEMDVIEHLIKIFCEYSKSLIIDVLEQCLRALGNLAINISNSELIVKYMFQDYLSEFILKNPTEQSIIKLGLDVIQTVSSLIFTVTSRNYEKKYLFTMLATDYTLKALTYCLTFTTQFEDVIVSALITLTYLINSNEIAKQFLQLSGDQKLIRALQQSGLNREVCYFSLKILQQLLKFIPQLSILDLSTELAQTIKQNPDNLDIFAEVINLGLMIQNQEMGQLISQVFVFTEENQIPEEIPLIHFIYKQLKNNEIHIAQSGINYLLNFFDNLKVSSILEKITQLPEGLQLFYQSNGLKQCIKQFIKQFTYTELSLNLLQIVYNVASYTEDYRYTIAEEHLQSLKDCDTADNISPVCRSKLQEVIVLLSKPLEWQSKITEEEKEQMQKGSIFKMYKEDGSRSYLEFFINSTLTEVNCKRKQTTFIKPKWRLQIDRIERIVDNYHEHPKLWLSSPFLNISWLAKTKNVLIMKQKLDPARALTLVAYKGTKPRSLNAYCPSIQEKKKWVRMIKQLQEENEQLVKKMNKNIKK